MPWRRLTCALAVAATSLASPASAFNLLTAYQAALGHDQTYAAARASFDATVEKKAQALGALLPSATLSANRAKNHLDNASAGFTADYPSSGFTLQLSQPVFNWPAIATYQQGEVLVAQGEAQLAADTHELMLRVIEAYLNVIAAKELVEAHVVLEKASLEQFQMMSEAMSTGTATITDVDEAKARLDLSTAQTIAARSDLEIKTHALSELTGREDGKVMHLRNKLPFNRPQPDSMASWVASAETDHPLVRAKRHAFEIAELDVERSRGGHLPTLELVASRQSSKTINTLSGAPNNTAQNSLMLQLSVPLFQGGRQFSRDREAVALKEKARAEWLDARRAARQLARESYLGVISGESQSIALESALASSVSSLAGNRMGLEVGTRKNLDVLNALSQVADSKQKLTKARVDLILAQVKLKAAVGRLSEQDFGELNAMLED